MSVVHRPKLKSTNSVSLRSLLYTRNTKLSLYGPLLDAFITKHNVSVVSIFFFTTRRDINGLPSWRVPLIITITIFSF